MTIEELIKSPDSPLSQEQRDALEKQYNSMLLTIKEQGTNLEKANANSRLAEKNAQDEEKRKRNAIDNGVGCLRAVKAMLQNSAYGATHLQRNFYGEAIVKFIDNSVAEMESEKDPYPF